MSFLRRFRQAGTGRFITRGEADSTPDWSVSETVDGDLRNAVQAVLVSRGYDVKGRTEVGTAQLERLLKAWEG